MKRNTSRLPVICGYGGNVLPEADEFDDLSNFDDRTLASLVGSKGYDPDVDFLLDRWRDRRVKSLLKYR
jgi:hypothetical protein